MHNIPFIPGGIDNLSCDSRSSRVTYQYYNTDTSRENLMNNIAFIPGGIDIDIGIDIKFDA